jgi:hypothetical protein
LSLAPCRMRIGVDAACARAAPAWPSSTRAKRLFHAVAPHTDAADAFSLPHTATIPPSLARRPVQHRRLPVLLQRVRQRGHQHAHDHGVWLPVARLDEHQPQLPRRLELDVEGPLAADVRPRQRDLALQPGRRHRHPLLRDAGDARSTSQPSCSAVPSAATPSAASASPA